MNECRKFENIIDRTHTGESSEEEREALLEHLESCLECSELFEIVGKLKGEELYPEPSDKELLSIRRAVIREVRSRRGVQTTQNRFVLASLFRNPLTIAGFMVVVLAIGFYLGRSASTPEESKNFAVKEVASDGFASTIQTVARSHNNYEDIMKSPFLYTNVHVTEGNAGMVNLSFDVSRHLDLTLKKRDPLVTEVLVQSLIEPSGVGARLNAIAISDNMLDPKIKKSLIMAMLHDDNLAVRMTAQSKLVEHPGDPEITGSLLTVVEREPSVWVRLVAIDYLTKSKIQPERLRRAIATGVPEGSEAVLVKAGPYLN
jgi:hypothetical protein